VFASWRYGLGRVSALTTEPAGPGTGSWSDWEGYGGFLSQTLTRTASGGAEPFRYELVREGAWLRLTAERRLPGTLQPAAEWLSSAAVDTGANSAAGARPPVDFREYAPGHFEARMPCAPDVQARLRAGAAGVAGSATLLVSDAWSDRAPELQVDPLAALELERLSAATGGGLSAEEPLASRGGPALILRDFAPWLLLLALLGYLAEVWWRRSPGFQGGPA